MRKEIIASGKDIIEAKENARAALGLGPLDDVDVSFEIIHAGSRGIFGIIGVKPAQVKASIEIPDPEEKRQKHHEKKKADKPERSQNNEKKTNNHQGKKKHKNAEKKNDAPKAEKPKSAVIPETDLKLELRDVKDGEDMSYEFIKTLISDIGLSATAALYSCEDGTRRINITGEDASVLIGHHGDTLDALQYLANLASARKNINGERDKSRVTIDIEGYRAKREEVLRALARRMAAKALRNKRSVMLEPMSAYERRIIHSEVQEIEGVSTNSIGSDNNRKIVIFLTDKKPKELFEEDEAKKTSLKEEFAAEEDDLTPSIADVEVSAEADLTDEEAKDETVTILQTVADESDIETSVSFDDSDIK